MESVKIKRLNHTIQEEISIILMREVKNDDLKLVTITGCDVTSDLSFAKIYYTVLDDNLKTKIQEELNKASHFIRGKLSEKIEIRHTPELKFLYDDSIEYGDHIEKIIDKIHEKDNN